MAKNFPSLVCIAVSVPLLKKGSTAFLKEELTSVEYHILDGDSLLTTELQQPESEVLILDAMRLTTLTRNNSIPSLPAATKVLLLAPLSSLPVVMRAGPPMTIHAWLPLESEVDKLSQTIQRLLEGGTDFTSLPEMLDTFLREQPLIPALTNRERQVQTLIELGYDNAQISDQLDLQPGTIKNYITTIYQKIGVKSRAEAVVFM